MNIPLPQRLRPQSFEEVIGQHHLVGPEGVLTQWIHHKKILSLLFWGPPGTGKTTLARLYAQSFDAHFITLNAVHASVNDIRQVIKESNEGALWRRLHVVFIDEIHRFNRAQQDSLLSYVEEGKIVLIGATTQNPSYCLSNALLSRLRVLETHPLSLEELRQLYDKTALFLKDLNLSEEAISMLLNYCHGDGRYLIHLMESFPLDSSQQLSLSEMESLLQRKSCAYDQHKDQHYALISAFHKSIRGSDPQAALYWFCRMLEGGEDPLYIARRMVRIASEDVGLADPQALSLTLESMKAYEILGSPEGELALAQSVVYLALSPKSNRIYRAFLEAQEHAKTTHHYSPPLHIRGAYNQWMKDQGVGKEYIYDHDVPSGVSGQEYFPKEITRRSYYHPIEKGFEREMKKRNDYYDKFRKNTS